MQKKLRPKGLCAANFPLAALRISLPDPTGISQVWTFFFKKNLQIEPAFAFYDNPLAQSRQLTELPAHQKAQDENWPRLRLGRIAIRFFVVAWVLDGAH